MAKIRTVLWDVGGVLLTNGWDRCERAVLLREFGIDRDAFEFRHLEVNDAWERGEITVDQYLDHTLFYEPRGFTRDAFFARMKDVSQWLPDSAIGLARSLAAAGGVNLVLVSNESRELMDHRIRAFDLARDFPIIIASAFVGLRKPDERIFRLALDVTQSLPEETVFVDDRIENATAASALGIHGTHYNGSQVLQEELMRLGVMPGDRQLSRI